MEQEQVQRYVTLFYGVRGKLDISIAEYYLLEMVYHLSFKTGYCYKTASSMALDMGMTVQGVNKMIRRLRDRGLLERLNDNAVRITDLYYSVQNRGGNKVSSEQYESETKFPETKFPTGNKVSESETKLQNRKLSSNKNNNRIIIKNNNLDKSKLAKATEHGNPEINELFSYWQQTVGYKLESRVQQNRYACNNLLKRYGVEKLQQLINGVAKAQNDQYAPRIADFTDLQAKSNQLVAWGRLKVQEQPKIVRVGKK